MAEGRAVVGSHVGITGNHPVLTWDHSYETFSVFKARFSRVPL